MISAGRQISITRQQYVSKSQNFVRRTASERACSVVRLIKPQQAKRSFEWTPGKETSFIVARMPCHIPLFFRSEGG